MNNKNCLICKREFIPHTCQKYCSKECCKIAQKQIEKIYKKIHKEKIIIQMKIYRIINKENLKKQMKKYYYANKRKINIKSNEWAKNKRKIDIDFKIKCYLRRRIWAALKGICKSKSTTKLIGCSIKQLKNYLESKFTKGMSWKNYGKWHIDHIKPCASFDLSKLSEQKKCFHYTNLQPLWAIENWRKNKNVAI